MEVNNLVKELELQSKVRVNRIKLVTSISGTNFLHSFN